MNPSPLCLPATAPARGALSDLWRRVAGGAALCVLLALSGCGVRYATIEDAQHRDLMLLGHDPVAYFTMGKPIKGYPNLSLQYEGYTYYFLNEQNRDLFRANPAKYTPQYGGFCAAGAAYGVKLGSDPTEWEIRDGRLFIFGDVVGHEQWLLDPAWHVQKADQMWPETRAYGHRLQSLKRFVARVPWYKNSAQVRAEWQAAHPGKTLAYDPGGVFQNLVVKYPGWRAREGHMQPALGVPGMDPCPPACPGSESPAFGPRP